MVTKTPNLGLSKPAGTDFVDINVLNGNMDILDEAVSNANVDITQDADGITIGTTELQDASATQDGLMTKAQATALEGKLDKSGGTMTGALSVPVLSNSGDSYLTGTVYTSNVFSGPWVQISSDNHALNLTDYKYNGIIIRRNDGYLLYRTFDEIKADLGINGKANLSDLTSLAGRVTALENIPNANGVNF